MILSTPTELIPLLVLPRAWFYQAANTNPEIPTWNQNGRSFHSYAARVFSKLSRWREWRPPTTSGITDRYEPAGASRRASSTENQRRHPPTAHSRRHSRGPAQSLHEAAVTRP